MGVLSPTAGDAQGFGVSVDAEDNTYITGAVGGHLPGAPERYAGDGDAFVAKFGADGAPAWVHQLGTGRADSGQGVATDPNGNVYVTGSTGGQLAGSPDSYQGGSDAFVAKYSPTGARLWVRELGSSSYDRAYAIAVDAAGYSFITGYSTGHLPGAPEHPSTGTQHVFVAKYTPTGSRAWVHEIGDGVGDGITIDTSGAVYLTGFDLRVRSGATHAFAARCSTAGTLQWFRRLTTNSTDEPRGIAAGADGFYVTGSVGIGQPEWDTFVAKYSTSGSALWRRQYGTDGTDIANAIAAGGSDVYIAGWTSAHLPGAPETSSSDMSETFVARYSASGTRIWTHQLADGAPNYGQGIALDPTGQAYVAGWTIRQHPNTRAGRYDAYVARFP